jgi:ATP-dependent protease ClpP protease subunit
VDDVAASLDAVDEMLRPSAIRLPLPPPPESVDEIGPWMELYRAHMELARFDAEMVRLEADRAKAEMEIAGMDDERERRALEMRKAQMDLERAANDLARTAVDAERADLELAEARRKDAERSSEPSEAMVYTFSKVVRPESVQEAIATLGEWSRRRPGAPLRIQLTSPGGHVLDGLALYDFLLSLRAQGHHVTVVALGFAASMGSILLQAGDVRVLGPNSYVMLHEVSSVAWGKVSEQVDDLEFTKRLQNRLVDILCERSTYTPKKLKKVWLKKDVWLDADQALAVGLIDVVEQAPAPAAL